VSRGWRRSTPWSCGAAFYVPTVAEAARARHLAQRPAASLTYFEGTDLAVVAHEHVAIIAGEDRALAEIDATQVGLGRESPSAWSGHGVYLTLEPGSACTYVRREA
jgi:hypothetical protein